MYYKVVAVLFLFFVVGFVSWGYFFHFVLFVFVVVFVF